MHPADPAQSAFSAAPRPPAGTLAWAARTGGTLNRRERLALLSPLVATTARYFAGRVRLLTGQRRTAPLHLDPATFKLPDSTLAHHAETACQELLSPALVNHSYRTFLFGLALAELDGVQPDVEHLYVTSLLHDITLEAPEPGHCFAVRGGASTAGLARTAGTDPATADRLAEAVTRHLTPGVGYADDLLAALIAGGALLDLIGLRLWDVPAAMVAQVIARYPRGAMKQALVQAWREEARAVPGGRAAWIERITLFTLFVRLAPFADDR